MCEIHHENRTNLSEFMVIKDFLKQKLPVLSCKESTELVNFYKDLVAPHPSNYEDKNEDPFSLTSLSR